MGYWLTEDSSNKLSGTGNKCTFDCDIVRGISKFPLVTVCFLGFSVYVTLIKSTVPLFFKHSKHRQLDEPVRWGVSRGLLRALLLRRGVACRAHLQGFRK